MFAPRDIVLTSQGGNMTALIALSGSGYDYLYLGSAAAAETDEANWIPFIQNLYMEGIYKDGAMGEGINCVGYTYAVPIASMDTDIQIASHAVKSGTWADRTIRLQSADFIPLDFGNETSLPDGTYQADDFTFSGGTGKTTAECLEINVRNGKSYATLQVKSANYQYLLTGATWGDDSAGKIQFNTTMSEGTSTTEIPIALNKDVAITGKTIAMSNPHEIDYFVNISFATPAQATRHSGSTASDTAAEISKAAFADGASNVVLARDDDFMDAMSSTGLAGALNAPILTTNRTSLSPAAAEEIARLGAGKVYIIGGKGAITLDVENALESQEVTVERVWGLSAADTSVACAEKIEEIDQGRNSQDTVIVATSVSFVDAVSVSSFAYLYHIPILIVSNSTANPATDRKLTADALALASSYSKIFIPGGPGALPKSSVEEVFVDEGVEIERIWGKTGLDTSNAVAKRLVETDRLSVSSVGVANGEEAMNGIDALAAASLCGKLKAPIILVDRAGTASGISDYITNNAGNIQTVEFFGGKYVIPLALEATISEIVQK